MPDAAGSTGTCFRLDGRRVLVTGASSGLGRAVARHAAASGATLVLSGRDASRLGSLHEELGGPPHRVQAADLTDATQLRQLAADAGSLDGLVLAAGVALVSPLRFTTPAVLRRVLAINLEARLHLCQQLAAFRAIADGASLVFLSSLSVSVGVAGHAAYAASLAANEGAARALAAEFAARAIRVNVVSPGLVRTPVLEGGEISREQLDALIARYPMGLGEPEDVAATVGFLLAPASRWMTGQVLRLDGGHTLGA